MYEFGRGVEQSYEEAVKLYRLSADQGNAYAQYNLGRMYMCGKGVGRSLEKAVKWFRSSAEQGSVSSQFMDSFLTLYINSE